MTYLKTTLLVGSAALFATAAAWADGPTRYRPYAAAGGYPPYVVAESRFGHGTVVGAVRPSGHGFQVRMPGGTWIDCRRSCAETLRVETVDFWENQGRDRIDNECGLFGCLTRKFHF